MLLLSFTVKPLAETMPTLPADPIVIGRLDSSVNSMPVPEMPESVMDVPVFEVVSKKPVAAQIMLGPEIVQAPLLPGAHTVAPPTVVST